LIWRQQQREQQEAGQGAEEHLQQATDLLYGRVRARSAFA
jgi:hypothetical protein